MRLLSLFIAVFFLNGVFSQESFVGKLVYSVEIADTSLRDMFPPSNMTIYTNDTVIRIETKTESLGQQVLIQHIEKKKAYLLVQSAMGDYAIQLPEEQSAEKKYTYKKAKGKKTVCGLPSTKLDVQVSHLQEPLEAYYYKKIAAKYIPGFEDFPGLPTDYQVATKDGIYHHKLIEIKQEPVSRDLFGIPSNFQKITMSDFVDLMTGGSEEE